MEINNTQFQNTVSKFKWLMAGLLIVVVALGAGWFVLGPKISGSLLQAKNSYQAVFLTNGQVYFGKLAINGEWMELTDIYYLQVTQNLQQATSDASKPPTSTGTAQNQQSNIQLVKLGSELHGPTDTMHIDRDKVLFWEDMKDDSKVVQAIQQYKNK